LNPMSATTLTKDWRFKESFQSWDWLPPILFNLIVHLCGPCINIHILWHMDDVHNTVPWQLLFHQKILVSWWIGH
jgi:hypothetical protein